jgi:two-component system NtrC family sensor kinase
MSPKTYRRKSQRSLRTILIVWFLLFAIAPLAFLTGFSIIRYEKAIDRELGHRLEGNAREVASMFTEFRTTLAHRRDRHVADPAFLYNLSTNQVDELSDLAKTWLRSDIASELTFFSRNGRMLLSEQKKGVTDIKEFVPPPGNAIYISEENLLKMKEETEYPFVELNQAKKISLILLSKVQNQSGKTAGYVEQLVEINQEFLDSIRNRMRVELVLLRKTGQVVASTHPDFYDYKKDFFSSYVQRSSSALFELTLRTDPFEFIMYPVHWGKTDFFIALGASKGDANEVLKGVNYAFFTVAGGVSLLLILIIFIISNSILSPLDDLVQATQDLPFTDQLVEIPIKSDTEIGLLTESFNEMSRQIIRVRAELKAKIRELELANKELMDAQSRLVHSSKLTSMGQLVAGVAHELNNPISFIYSNMAHLRDYSNKLIELAEAADKNPTQVAQLKAQLDIDYIKTDLPKLISSCEDGARRVRDIVLGLRNFSRLEEAKLKEIDINDSIDSTLNLLSGEIKNRIQLHKYYGDLPKVSCYATQINQVFMNILSNAVQAIEGAGNIWITTKKLPPAESSRLGYSSTKEIISISIQDSGKGAAPDVLNKVFDPFFSTKGVGQGTGLGLSISYGIMQTHGGDIQVKSQVGIGTEFVLLLPVKMEPPKEAAGAKT